MTQSLTTIRAQFSDALPAGSVNGATVQGLIDTLAVSTLFPSPTLIDGQLILSGTGSVQLTGSSVSCSEVICQSDPSNTNNVKIGNATPVIVLQPGQDFSIVTSDISLIYAQSVSGSQTVNWLARV